MKFILPLCLASLLLFSCKKKSSTSVTPQLDSPAYNFYPGTPGINNVSTVFTKDGNLAVVGQSATGNILLMKLTTSGNQLLRKEITLPGADYYTIASIAPTADNGYLVCGSATMKSATGSTTGTSMDLLIMKLSSAGDMVWTKTYGGSSDDYGYYIIPTKDGNFLACGYGYSYTSEAYDDIYMVKIDPSGNSIWAKSYARHEQQIPHSVTETKNGDYIVTGTDEPDGSNTIVYLLRVDVNGNKLWDQTIDPASAHSFDWKWAYCGAECNDGSIMICGNVGTKMLLIKTNSAGKEIWEKTYAADNPTICGRSIKVNSDNSCVITGGYNEVITDSSRCFLMKTDQDGNELFMKILPASVESSGENVLVDKNGDLIVTGFQYTSQTSSNIFLTRTDAKGNYK